ncbi:flagellar protein FlaG [Geovibrio thiophilus]|uniref:Flagellar protein FlaG n=1 Tax=Geovibrio thiophilus TaxID=139438 RepID=A0A3R5X4H1_9BACT|nr:flagellar protein FlaG [Geovibrio thiophilus]QAR34223.1 flagellar protein FlaG [Geovibrio thiophilus]
MIESVKNVQTGAPDAGSGAKAQATQSVSQSIKLVNEKLFGNAAEKVDTEKENKKVKPEEVQAAVEKLNESLRTMDVRREFSVEKQLNAVIVKLIDKDHGSVIKQIPSEEALRLSRNIKEMVGLMLDEKF